MLRKIVIVGLFLIAIVLPALAQRTQRPQRQQRVRPGESGQLEQGRGVERIQKALNLTADQVNGLKTLIESQRQTLQPLVKEARDKAQALRDLQQQPNPNPTDVGNAVLAMKAVRERMRGARQNFQQSLGNLLTTEQREMLDQMKQGMRRFGRQPGNQGRRRNRNIPIGEGI